MCLMAPLRVLAVESGYCVVEMGGARDRVSTLLVDTEIAVGDWVLVMGGAIMRRLEPDQASAMESAHRIATEDEPQLEKEP